jgi:hypothetical protein
MISTRYKDTHSDEYYYRILPAKGSMLKYFDIYEHGVLDILPSQPPS